MHAHDASDKMNVIDDDVTALVKELQMKLELKEQEVMQLRGNACRPCAECHSLRKAVVAESLIADAVHQASPDLLKQVSPIYTVQIS